MAFTDIIDKSLPEGTDDPSEADDNMRRIQGGFQEILNVDHYVPLTGTEISDEDAGEHRKVTLRTGDAPTEADDKGMVYAKDVSDKAELFYIDEDGNEAQLTSAGKILSASLDGTIVQTEDDGHSTPTTTGYQLFDVNGSLVKVYTKYFTGTTDADATTAIAHGLDAATDILRVTASVRDNAGLHRVTEIFLVDSINFGYQLVYGNTNIELRNVGAAMQSQPYVIGVDYIA